MAHFKEVDYCSEEVMTVPTPGGFGRHLGGGGVQQYVVKETVEEVDQISPVGRRGHGHHGQHGSGHFEVRESKFEEDINTRTGEFHERKENVVVRA